MTLSGVLSPKGFVFPTPSDRHIPLIHHQKYLNWDVTVDLVAHIFKMNKIVMREGKTFFKKPLLTWSQSFLGIMYLAPKGAEGSVGQAESIFQRLLSFIMGDQHRAEVYLTTRAIKKAVKLIVFEQKDVE